MDALVALQAADGSWDLSRPLAAIIGRRISEIQAALARTSAGGDGIRRAWATALALAWLQLNAADRQDEWRLLADKARRWLEGVTATPPGGESTWMEAALRFLD